MWMLFLWRLCRMWSCSMYSTNSVFQLRVLVETKLSFWGVAKASLSVWNVTTNKLILLLLMDIVHTGNNTVTDWIVFALEHTDLSKIIVNNPTGSLFQLNLLFLCWINGYKNSFNLYFYLAALCVSFSSLLLLTQLVTVSPTCTALTELFVVTKQKAMNFSALFV